VKVIVYADFNCVCCYLTSQRADRLTREGTAEVDWRAVEHLPRLPVTGNEPRPGEAGSWPALDPGLCQRSGDGYDGGLSHDGAGHGFFYCRTPMYQPEAAMDGWEKVSGCSARCVSN
jgi:hypothetical protein